LGCAGTAALRDADACKLHEEVGLGGDDLDGSRLSTPPAVMSHIGRSGCRMPAWSAKLEPHRGGAPGLWRRRRWPHLAASSQRSGAPTKSRRSGSLGASGQGARHRCDRRGKRALLPGQLAAWPVVARAQQQPERVRARRFTIWPRTIRKHTT
jgi:hypothetical protein